MAHTMNADALKAKLAALRLSNETAGQDGDKLEARATCRMLVGACDKLVGKTKAAFVPASAAYKLLSETYPQVGTTLHQAEALFHTMIITSSRCEQIEALLVGPVLHLPADAAPNAVVQLTPQDRAGMSLERFLAVLSASRARLDQVVSDCEAASDRLDESISHATTEATRLEQVADSLGIAHPPELGVARTTAQGVQQKSATDPLGADDDIASAVTPLLDLVNRKMQAAKLKRDHDWQQLTQSLDGFRRTAQRRPGTESAEAAAAYAKAVESLTAKTNAKEAEGLIAAYAMVAFR